MTILLKAREFLNKIPNNETSKQNESQQGWGAELPKGVMRVVQMVNLFIFCVRHAIDYLHWSRWQYGEDIDQEKSFGMY